MAKIEIKKTELVEETELSEIEHTRILSVLDAVATLSERIGQPVITGIMTTTCTAGKV